MFGGVDHGNHGVSKEGSLNEPLVVQDASIIHVKRTDSAPGLGRLARDLQLGQARPEKTQQNERLHVCWRWC